MPRGIDSGRHPGRQVSRIKPTLPEGYGNYRDPNTFETQRQIDRDFDRREYEYNEQMKRQPKQ